VSDRLKNRAATVPKVVDREASPRVPLPAELALAVECCRWTFAGGAFDTRSAESPIDWQQFIRLIRFHRVQGLVRSAARAGIEPPPDTPEAFCVRFADRIAYLAHDALDALRAGSLRPDAFPRSRRQSTSICWSLKIKSNRRPRCW